MFESCVDATWQLERFPTPKEKSKLRRQMDSSGLEEALPIVASSEEEGDFGVTWIEPPPTSKTARQAEKDGDAELPAAAHLHSCDYCPWGYFGNESSEVDLYTYAALHIEIPSPAQRRLESQNPTTPVKRARSTRKRKEKQE
jgi:hypothetical protein